jgi:hypothetical protein
MTDLVREEDGSIRWCDKNIAKLGYWWTVKHYYRVEYFVETLTECCEYIWQGLQATLAVVILPVLPLILANTKLKEAKENVEYERVFNRVGGSK